MTPVGAAPKTAKIVLGTVKEPDAWGTLIQALGLSEAVAAEHFEWGEYASVELEIDENLRVVAGRVLPLKEPR